jgi:TRAP-type uncharacterized transport system fused permease subunit
MMKIAEGVTLVLLDTSFELESIIPALLYLMGLWAVFCKSGVKGWWALIPCARQYKLGLCAGREPEGRMLAVMDFLMVATSLPGLYLQLDSATEMFLALVGLIAALISEGFRKGRAARSIDSVGIVPVNRLYIVAPKE